VPVIDLLRPWRAPLTDSRGEKYVRLALTLTYMALIFGVSSIPGSEVPLVVDDRVAHFVAYAGLGVMLMLSAVAFQAPVSRSGAAAMFAAGVAYAASDEFHQLFVRGRHASISDLLFDAAGLATSITLLTMLTRDEARRRS
jgi:hypothetical protein